MPGFSIYEIDPWMTDICGKDPKTNTQLLCYDRKAQFTVAITSYCFTYLFYISNCRNTRLVKSNGKFVSGCQMVAWKPVWKKYVNGPKLNVQDLNG